MSKVLLPGSFALSVLLFSRGGIASGESASPVAYRSPEAVAFSGDGKTLLVAERGSRTLAYVDFESGDVRKRVGFETQPLPVKWPPKQVAEGVDLGLAIAAAHAGADPAGPVVPLEFRLGLAIYLSHGKTIGILDRWNPRVLLGPRESAVEGLQLIKGIAPNPQSAAITPDGRRLLITCDTLTEEDRSVCLVDRIDGSVRVIPIPGGSSLRGVAISPDGRYALVVHVQARSHLPATQVVQGWVFTNVVTLLRLDLEGEPVTLPLDHPGEFYATPFDIAITSDGKTGYVSHAGADVVSVLDLKALETTADEIAAGDDYVARDLRLSGRYVRARIPVGSNPRAMALDPSGDRLVVANHLDDSIGVIDTTSNRLVRTIPLGSRQADLARRGERYFNSAGLSFSGQFACASCHPDAGTDGLNWDLPADGIGNFKNTKTLLGVHGTEPFGWLGTTGTLPQRFGTTLEQTFQHRPADDELAAITAYLEQLDHADLPSRVDPTSPEATRGKALFEGKAGCAVCHRGPQLTDRRRHNVGTYGPGDLSQRFDTPSLVGVTETPPYLHDGRANNLRSVFLQHNASGRHGKASALDRHELEELIAFLRSL